jgi:hypothetical protein
MLNGPAKFGARNAYPTSSALFGATHETNAMMRQRTQPGEKGGGTPSVTPQAVKIVKQNSPSESSLKEFAHHLKLPRAGPGAMSAQLVPTLDCFLSYYKSTRLAAR